MAGTIPSAVIKQFLNAPRDDHRWMKALTHEQLDVLIDQLKPRPNLNKLLIHQKVSFLLGVSYPRFAFWLDMGTGKTLVALELIRYWWQCGIQRRAIVVVKSDKAFPTWVAQIKQWGIDLPYVLLPKGSSEEKWRELEDFKEGIILVTYPGLTRMLSKLVYSKKKQRNVLKIWAKQLETFMEEVGTLVLDESTKVGHQDSLITRVCARISKRVQFCYLLAGRPFGRDPELLWSQHNILDGGETFGETLGLFRAAFYNAEENPWTENKYAKDYVFDKRLKPRLMRIAQHRSIAYAEQECGEVAQFVPITESVSLPQEAKAYYKKVVEQIITSKGNLQAMENAFIRMRQLSSGFLGFRKTDDAGKRVEIEFGENPKLEALLELLESVPDERKAIVFYDFTWSGRKISSMLKTIDRKGIWLWSGTKNSAVEQERFICDPGCTVAVLQNQVGAYSLDGLQDVANYCFFYESPVPVLDRDQAEHRLRRKGQIRRVFQYDLVVKGTLDERILQFHREGEDLLQALRANPEALLRDL